MEGGFGRCEGRLRVLPQRAVPARLEVSPGVLRRRWSAGAKARETVQPGADVSAVARAHGLNPQQLFAWRRKAIRSGALAILADGAARPQGFARLEVAPGNGDWLRQCGKSSSATRRSVPAATLRRPF
ncbi:MAG: hypothetical protein EOS00_04680 [Mesorhizobium sp.]|nr:MAG: hypothetical protein EOS00_04680 [Mesorhizobium sp.]